MILVMFDDRSWKCNERYFFLVCSLCQKCSIIVFFFLTNLLYIVIQHLERFPFIHRMKSINLWNMLSEHSLFTFLSSNNALWLFVVSKSISWMFILYLWNKFRKLLIKICDCFRRWKRLFWLKKASDILAQQRYIAWNVQRWNIVWNN